MWHDERGARHVVVQAARLNKPDASQVREVAIGIIRGIALDNDLKEALWHDPVGCMQAVISAAGFLEPMDRQTRILAITTLQSVSCNVDLVEEMWSDKAVRAAVVLAAKSGDKEVRAPALGCLQNMSCAKSNVATMWADVNGARIALIAGVAYHDKSHGPVAEKAVQDRKSKLYALGALYNISCHIEDRVAFWSEKGIRGDVLLLSRLKTRQTRSCESAQRPSCSRSFSGRRCRKRSWIRH